MKILHLAFKLIAAILTAPLALSWMLLCLLYELVALVLNVGLNAWAELFNRPEN